jgi:hypothetical protein
LAGIYIPTAVITKMGARTPYSVKIWDGAVSRSASKGGFTSLQGVIMHHTADAPPHGPSTWQYTLTNTSNAPEYNFGIDQDGTINWLAAGGVNSSGKGGPLQLQTGKIAQDGANYVVPAISLDIDGVGETCSKAMMIASVICAGELIMWMGRQNGDVTAHKEYCGPGTSTPGRKPDPYGPWEAGSWGSGISWGPQQGRIDSFRGEVWWYIQDPAAYVANATGSAPVPPTPTPPTPTPTPPATNWPASLTGSLPTIKKGDQGIQVKKMQHLLAAAGYLNESNTANYDGVWGNGTDGAKQRFDHDHGLAPSPPTDCGPKSWAALCGSMPNLVKGNSGADVKKMQHLLAACGFMNEANTSNYDGQWGNGTDSAKVNFDNASGLTPSPPTDCGQKSWTALLT